jgi:2-alkenal reductase
MEKIMTKRIPLSMFFVLLMLSTFACNLVNPAIFSSLQSTLEASTALKPAVQEPAAVEAPPIVSQENDLTRLYENVIPGIVSIKVETASGGGMGTGFVYDTNGYIVTNEHVIDGYTAIEVDFSSGYKINATVVGADKDSDIAVLKVDAPSSELHPLPLGDSRAVKVGQSVVAIGNPFGLNGTMTLGIISALGRTQESNRQASNGGTFSVADMIQTDAAINPGNSGGPLLNLNGEVLGINRSIRTANTVGGEASNSGVGFALPINLVKRVVPAIIKVGQFDYPYMGISTLNSDLMNLAIIKELGLERMTGVYVTDVLSGGPAEKAGVVGASLKTGIEGLLSGGDLIIAVDGREVKIYDDLIGYLVEYKSPGESIVLTVLRGAEKKELTLNLIKRP